MIPAEQVPDGAIFAPHHLTTGLVFTVPFILRVWDNHPRREPIGVLLSVAVALVGFLLVWPYYPPAGTLLVLTGLTAASVATAGYRHLPGSFDGWTRRSRYPVLLGLAVAWDDWLSHTFGVWTPLDWVWSAALHDLITATVIGL